MHNHVVSFIGPLLFSVSLTCFGQSLPAFKSSISKIPDDVKTLMKKYTWTENCPIPLSQLRYLQLSYYGYDHRPHEGILIVNQELAPEIITTFKSLYDNKFPIQSMLPMYRFKGDDEDAMAANNTSSFNCRQVTGHPGIYSQHSYGRAIDINTKTNPFVKGTTILPKNAEKYRNRCQSTQGIIVQDGIPYKLFISHRWDWGGSWYDVHDYQHFEKRANGELRNPFGYPKK